MTCRIIGNIISDVGQSAHHYIKLIETFHDWQWSVHDQWERREEILWMDRESVTRMSSSWDMKLHGIEIPLPDWATYYSEWIDLTDGKCYLSKDFPGYVAPIHLDTRSMSDEEVVRQPQRLWIPLNKDPGHLFCTHTGPVDYQVGDVVTWKWNRTWHGAANIGTTSRFILMIDGTIPG